MKQRKRQDDAKQPAPLLLVRLNLILPFIQALDRLQMDADALLAKRGYAKPTRARPWRPLQDDVQASMTTLLRRCSQIHEFDKPCLHVIEEWIPVLAHQSFRRDQQRTRLTPQLRVA